jgi:cell division protein ZapA
MNETLDVEIYGQKYSLKMIQDPDKILNIAGKIDQKMKEFAKNLAITSTSKLAILAALNIVYEHELEFKESSELNIESELDDLISLIDDENAISENNEIALSY